MGKVSLPDMGSEMWSNGLKEWLAVVSIAIYVSYQNFNFFGSGLQKLGILWRVSTNGVLSLLKSGWLAAVDFGASSDLILLS